MDALGEAAEKLDTVRALMSTRGSHAVPKKKVQELKSAVAKDGARLTSHGLVLPDTDDDDDMRAATKVKKQYKWANERKK